MCFGDFKNGTISTAITVSDIASIAIFVRNMNAIHWVQWSMRSASVDKETACWYYDWVGMFV